MAQTDDCTWGPGIYLELLRTDAGLTQDDVASAMGRSRSWLSKIESGANRPGFTITGRIAYTIGTLTVAKSETAA